MLSLPDSLKAVGALLDAIDDLSIPSRIVILGSALSSTIDGDKELLDRVISTMRTAFEVKQVLRLSLAEEAPEKLNG